MPRALPTRTCDECRARKRKCVLPANAEGRPVRCNACRGSSIRCTFDLLYKKRGPQPKPHDILVRLPSHKNIYDLPRALEAFCPKPVVDFLVRKFMDHLYPMTPVVHKPTFFARLNDNRHLHDPVYFSLLISILVTTVCTLPGMIQSCKEIDLSFTHAGRKDMLETGERLILRIRSSNYYDVLPVDKWACAFLHVVANGQLNLIRRATMHHAEAAAMAKELKLHVVDAYNGLNKIEQQLRKKALWMHFMSERHLDLNDMSMDQTRTYVTQMTRAMDDLLPLEVDDEFITEREVLTQPEGRCSLAAGLNGMTAINMNLMQANPANPAFTPRRIESLVSVEVQGGQGHSCISADEIKQLDAVRVASEQIGKLEHCLDGLPNGLSLSSETPQNESTPDSELLNSQLQTMKANLYVTHLWAQNLLVEQMRTMSESNLYGKTLSLMDDLCWRTQERVGHQLLDLLRTLPRTDLLHNGSILVVKVRSVGASILEYASTRRSAPFADPPDLVQYLANILADLDLELGEAKFGDNEECNKY